MNLFENASFGSLFLTRDGTLAIANCLVERGTCVSMLREGGQVCYRVRVDNGWVSNNITGEYSHGDHPNDIVSIYQEEEEVIDALPSRHQAQDYLEKEGYLDENGSTSLTIDEAVQIGFEWGYKSK